MSQSAHGAVISEHPIRRLQGRAKMQRVWELVSELVRVIANREPLAVDYRPDANSEEDPPIPVPVVRRTVETRSAWPRRFFRKAAASSTPMPAVWRSVQLRALEQSLKRHASALGSADAPAGDGSTDAGKSTPGRAGEIDWSPFMIARINDDFAGSTAHQLPD
jgi:hypothetical protein